MLFSALPETPLTPTLCFRRAGASTLSAYTLPNTDSTSRRPPVTSRSLGLLCHPPFLAATPACLEILSSAGPIRGPLVSESSLCSENTAPCADSEESIPVDITTGNHNGLT